MNDGQTRRIAFTVQYDGEDFFGWQLQVDQRTVQGELEAALGRLFDTPVRIIGSGRTDRGVHARGQVAAVDAPLRWEPSELRRALNAVLPDSVWIAHAAEVPPRFHPRYDAISRSYVYRIGIADVTASPFHRRWCWPLCRPVDELAIRLAAEVLTGDHSFRAFAKAGQEERGDRCIVTRAEWLPWDGFGLEFHISANRFLHHMVRYIVGTAAEIGLGRRPIEDMGRLLLGEEGLETSPPAPSRGLFLDKVRYPDGTYTDDVIPSEVEGSAPVPRRRADPSTR